MIAATATMLAGSADAAVLASSGDGSGSALFGLLLFLVGPAAGIGTYIAIYNRYRNAGERYRYTTTTDAKVEDLKVRDDAVASRRGARHARMHGDNRGHDRDRLRDSRVEY